MALKVSWCVDPDGVSDVIAMSSPFLDKNKPAARFHLSSVSQRSRRRGTSKTVSLVPVTLGSARIELTRP